MSRLYFDYNATTPLAPGMEEIVSEAIRGDWKNPSSVHREGCEAKNKLEEARRCIASHLEAQPDEIVFTSGATEANNAVLYSVWDQRPPGRNKIITSSVEHASIMNPLRRLKEQGAVIDTLPVNYQGAINLDHLDQLLDNSTLLVSIMMANNETGMIFPISEIAQIVKQHGVLMHTDAVCGVGRVDLSFRKLNVDFLSFSGHKFYGPKGIGGLFVRDGVFLKSLLLGGSQEGSRRAGTENILGILGLQYAFDYAFKDLHLENKRLWGLRKKLIQNLKNKQILVHEGQNQLPGTLNIYVPHLEGQTLLARLDLEGVAVSYGSACHSGTLEASPVLLAMGLSKEEASRSIRLSFGRMTTEEEIDRLMRIFGKVLK